MKKIISEKAGFLDWEKIGLFDDTETVKSWIKENWGSDFEEYRKEVLKNERYEPTISQWLEYNELRTRTVDDLSGDVKVKIEVQNHSTFYKEFKIDIDDKIRLKVNFDDVDHPTVDAMVDTIKEILEKHWDAELCKKTF